MKNFLFLIGLFISVTAFSQIQALNQAVRTTTPNPNTIANALDASKAFVASGTNDYVVTPGLGIYSGAATYALGDQLTVVFSSPNTLEVVTLNVNSEGVRSIVDAQGANPAAGFLNGPIKLYYNGTAWQAMGGGSGGGEVFEDDVTFVLPVGYSFGKYLNGETAAWEGLTPIEAILDAAIDYIDPVFTAFSISGQSTTVEGGTTLSGSKPFTWSVSQNSGVVSTIDIYNISTASTLLAGTANDGSQAVTITTVQLNSNGATQSWRGVGNNSSPSGTFNSSTFTVTARYFRFYGPDDLPTNSAEVRALPSSAFHTGATTFTLATGTTQTSFIVALPPGVTISSVIDVTALNAVITSSYVLTGTISVTDAGGTSRTYNLYQMSIGVPYGVSHNHSITTAN